MNDQTARVFAALDRFRLEVPSWGFADTGTRFGIFRQPAAAVTVAEKLADAGFVHRLTGICPTVALHMQWDLSGGIDDVATVQRLAADAGIRPGSINPTFFQDQRYKYGSFGNPDPEVRRYARAHGLASVDMATRLGSRDVSCWFADGSNYPGTASIRHRKQFFEEELRTMHDAMTGGQRLLVEYKPFEPAFYHTDIADWGMALLLARAAGPRARVLVDTGHHYQSQNIEQIVAWLLAEDMLGGFHFNDRRYADDDLTAGSIDPYQLFRIFHEIRLYESEHGPADIAYMIDQSHNLKGKIESMVQTTVVAQSLYAKAALVDLDRLAAAQASRRLVEAESCLQDAFAIDVRPMIADWRRAMGLPVDPLDALWQSGYVERITTERSERRAPHAAPTLGS
ncbi:MAG TPA: TIM barrel protein [Vicinamibacterales bacterium]|nr:TIM barrel protein [Vicinamibacterales bacterium]